MEQIKKQIEKKLELEKEILELLTEEKLIALIKGYILGLEFAIKEIEKLEKENADKFI